MLLVYRYQEDSSSCLPQKIGEERRIKVPTWELVKLVAALSQTLLALTYALALLYCRVAALALLTAEYKTIPNFSHPKPNTMTLPSLPIVVTTVAMMLQYTARLLSLHRMHIYKNRVQLSPCCRHNLNNCLMQ